ncbi:hypothetical protein YC2023_029911 [Brassica napus]
MKLTYNFVCFSGMDFHELLEIPQGDRRKYHDDVSVIIGELFFFLRFLPAAFGRTRTNKHSTTIDPTFIETTYEI